MRRYTLYNVYVSVTDTFVLRELFYIYSLKLFYQGQPSGEAFIQMDSEASAYACASQRHHRYMIYGKKQRYIEVFQCSGDDMNLVLTGAVTPPSTKALLSPGTLTTQTSATFTHPSAPTAMPVPVPTAQPPPSSLWDIHALVQAQAAQHAQAQAAQAQAVQAQAIRNQDLWLMALASNSCPTSTTPASPSTAAAAAAATSKSLALQSPNPIAQIPAYAMASPTAAAVAAAHAAFHAPSATSAAAAAAATPFLLFNVHPHHPRIPILRAPTSHGLLAPIAMAATPALNPASIISLKRTWDATFPANAANSVAAKRPTWHAPAAAFHAPAPTTTPGLPYPAQFYPQI